MDIRLRELCDIRNMYGVIWMPVKVEIDIGLRI